MDSRTQRRHPDLFIPKVGVPDLAAPTMIEPVPIAFAEGKRLVPRVLVMGMAQEIQMSIASMTAGLVLQELERRGVLPPEPPPETPVAEEPKSA